MGYILNFQNNSNNMKNEIMKKITSLTLMTIMFAGGMTLAIPGFLPDSAIPIEAFADRGSTSGSLYISSTEIQGAQVIEIVVDDSSLSKTATNGSVTVDITPSQGTTETVVMFQAINGLYYAYMVDDISSEAADDISSTSMDFGTDCDLTLTMDSAAFAVTATDTNIESDSCTDPDSDTGGEPFSVLANEPTDIPVASGTVVIGPASLGNVSGSDAGTWPIIYGFDFADDNLIEYGSDAIEFTFGSKAAGVSFTTTGASDGQNAIVVPGQKIQFTIDDNGLNIDPTAVDAWTFLATSASPAPVIFEPKDISFKVLIMSRKVSFETWISSRYF